MNNIQFVAVLLLTFPLLITVAIAEETTSELSVEELKATAQIIRAIEDSLINVRIDSEAWVEEGASPSGPWEKTPVYWSTTAYYEKISSDKSRIDVHKNVLPWKNGAAPYLQQSYSTSFDGVKGMRKQISSSYNKKTFNSNTGFILPKRPEQLAGFNRITGIEASLFFHYRGVPEPLPERFSANFEAIAEPNSFLTALTNAMPGYSDIEPLEARVIRKEFRGRECLKMICMVDLSHNTWWLDPSRGFALLKIVTFKKDENGNEQLQYLIDVKKLQKVAENIWWPTEAYFVEPPLTPDKPWKRIVYRASNVVVNDPNFDKSVFTVEFPNGYKVKDEVAGKTYTVGDPNAS